MCRSGCHKLYQWAVCVFDESYAGLQHWCSLSCVTMQLFVFTLDHIFNPVNKDFVGIGIIISRALDKREYLRIIFLISQ